MIKFLLTALFFLISSLSFAATNYCSSANTDIAMKFEEASGALQDCTSNGNNSSSQSVTYQATGKYGYGVSVANAGGQGFTVTASTSADNMAGGSTICTWVKATDYGQNNGNFGFSTLIWDIYYRSQMLGVNNDGNVYFLTHWDGGNQVWHTTGAPFSTGAWHHLCVTYNDSSTSNLPIFYVDGSSVASTTNTPCCVSADSYSGEDVQVLRSDIYGGGRFNGVMDELLQYHGILSSSAISSLYSCGIDGSHCGSPNHGFTNFLNHV